MPKYDGKLSRCMHSVLPAVVKCYVKKQLTIGPRWYTVPEEELTTEGQLERQGRKQEAESHKQEAEKELERPTYPQSLFHASKSSKLLPNSNTNQGPSALQIHEPTGAFLTQTNTVPLFLNIVKNFTVFPCCFYFYLFYAFY